MASVFDLPDAHTTSLSIITPPQVSLPILKTSLLEVSKVDSQSEGVVVSSQTSLDGIDWGGLHLVATRRRR